jgi:hypothetical protein
MSDHAVFNFSASARGLECPASWLIAADMPVKDISGEAASEGTKVHKTIEYHIKHGIPSSAVKEDHGYAEALELFLGFIEQLGPTRPNMEAYRSPSEMKVGFQERDDAYGTLDYAHIPANTDHIWTIVDYKNGAWPVAAYDNKQMLSYAAALVDTINLGHTVQFKPRWFRLVIVQPNSFEDSATPIKQWMAPLEYVTEHKTKMLAAIERAHQDPIPGPHCRWCPAFGNCSATQELLPFLTEAIKLPPYSMPDEAIVRILQILRGLDDFKKGLDKELTTRLGAGKSIKGASITLTSPHRKWADPLQAAQQLFAAYQTLGIEPVSPAAAERLGETGKIIAKSLSTKPTGQPKAEY